MCSLTMQQRNEIELSSTSPGESPIVKHQTALGLVQFEQDSENFTEGEGCQKVAWGHARRKKKEKNLFGQEQ